VSAKDEIWPATCEGFYGKPVSAGICKDQIIRKARGRIECGRIEANVTSTETKSASVLFTLSVEAIEMALEYAFTHGRRGPAGSGNNT